MDEEILYYGLAFFFFLIMIIGFWPRNQVVEVEYPQQLIELQAFQDRLPDIHRERVRQSELRKANEQR